MVKSMKKRGSTGRYLKKTISAGVEKGVEKNPDAGEIDEMVFEYLV